jgi:predicted dehydrogenase
MRQFDDFSSAVTGDGELLVDGEEALKAVRIIRGIYRSSEEGRRITL